MVDLNKLYSDCNKIIEDLDPTFIEGPINWADLYCVEAYQKTSHDGISVLGVVISEADPVNEELHHAIRLGLEKYGWDKNMDVITEW